MPLPVASDLIDFMQGAGLVDDPPTAQQNLLGFQDALDAAVEELEDALGVEPLINEALAVSTREFDVPYSGMLELVGGGLLAAPTEVRVSGLEYQEGTSYFLYPRNALLRGKPYRYIYFGRQRGRFQSGDPWEDFPLSNGTGVVVPTIEVTGVWGYSATMTDRLKRLLLQRAALDLMPELSASKTEELVDQSLGTVSEAVEEEWSEDDPQTGSVRIKTATSSSDQLKDYARQALTWQRAWQNSWDRAISQMTFKKSARTIRLSPVG